MNLLPETARVQSQTAMAPQAIGTAVVLACCLGVWILNFFYWHQIQHLQYEYTAHFQPVQVKLQAHNAEMAQRTQYMRRVQTGMKSDTNWPAILVALSDSKPQGITVKTIKADKKQLQISLAASSQAAVREWKDRLQKGAWFSQAQIRKWQTSAKGNTAELDLLLSHENTSADTKDN